MAVRHPDWFTKDELTGFVAISESTPGPIGINIATYAGYKIAGIIGSLLCTFSVVLPSFIIIILIAKALDKFKNSRIVQGAFYGIRPATSALILCALVTSFLPVLVETDSIGSVKTFFAAVDYGAFALFAAVLAAAMIFKKLHPIVFIAAGALAGIIFRM